jgi:serine/threonine-protein kinase
MMADITWQKVKEIFYEVIELPSEERQQHLQTSCDSIELLNEVNALLAAHDSAEKFLEPPSLSPGDADNKLFIGKYFGRYKIEKLIARGGMGLVYLGIRDDEVKQQAAVKIINPGAVSGTVIKRFYNERQALANLNHPNISRLLDGGITDDGIQYLVMEYIEGIPIDIYCDTMKLNTRSRLHLFLKVMNAVQYAHQNLIVHRDLKPANILVTKEGEPKLLDFGIAKILAAEGDEESTLTHKGAWNLTPEYASPEQVKGEPITTASDVYSSGIVLYKLLTGHNPYKIKSILHSDISKVITGAEPLKPSEVIYKTTERHEGDAVVSITPEYVSRTRNESIEKLNRTLKGDLDNIISMAVRKEPGRRYPSVEHFAGDIKNFLDDHPVSAHSDTLAYRSKKFIRRHKAAVISASLIILLLLSGIAGIIWQAGLTAKERDTAKLEAEKANRIKSFLAEMITAPDPKQDGGEVKVIDVVRRAAGNISEELKGQPAVEIEVRTLLGTTYQNLGIYNSAESEMEKALALSIGLYGEKTIETALAQKNLALVYHYKGDYGKAESLYTASLKMRESLEKSPSLETAKLYDSYGTLMADAGDYEKSKDITIKALAIAEKIRGSADYEVGIIQNNLATNYNYLGDLDKADSLYRLSLKIFRKKYGDNHLLVSSVINNLAFIHIFKKEHHEAIPLLEESVKIKENILEKNHPDLILAYSNLGSTYFNDNQFDKAEKILKKSVDIALINFDENNINVSRSYMWYGRALEASGKAREGLYYLSKAYEVRKKEVGEKSRLTLTTQGQYGECLLSAGYYAEAEQHLIGSYMGLVEISGREDEAAKNILSRLVELYNIRGNKQKAEYYAALQAQK